MLSVGSLVESRYEGMKMNQYKKLNMLKRYGTRRQKVMIRRCTKWGDTAEHALYRAKRATERDLSAMDS